MTIIEHEVRDDQGRLVRPAIGLCACGREVELGAFTCSCACGAEYNWGGQRLAPRGQWDWDVTGPFEEDA